MKHKADRKLNRVASPLFHFCFHTCTKHYHQRATVKLQAGQGMCYSTALGKRKKYAIFPEIQIITAKYCATASKKNFFISQPRPVDEGIRRLEHLSQRLLLLEVRHRLITALNILLRPSWNLESAAPSLWRRHISRAGDQHKVQQVSLKAINIWNVCAEIQPSFTRKRDVMEIQEKLARQWSTRVHERTTGAHL